MRKIFTYAALLTFLTASVNVFGQYSWSNVGNGVNLPVRALAADTSNGILYAGGLFTQAGSITASGIAKWDGNNWSPLAQGIISGTGVNSLVMFSGNLIAGGSFTNIGGVVSKNIAQWDGINWSPLGNGLEYTGATSVSSLVVYNNQLYAGGTFTSSGSTQLNYVAKWDGANWVSLGTGTNGPVNTLCEYNGELYAAGYFTDAGGVSVQNIAKWTGTVWEDVDGGVEYTGATSVSIMRVYNNELYVGGNFDTVGSAQLPVKNIAKWDGNTWSDVGGGVDYTGATSVSIMKVYNNEIVVGGTFDTAGTIAADYIVKWDGVNWTPLGLGMDNTVRALEVMGDTLYAGGLFLNSDGITTPYIAKWSKVSPTSATGIINTGSVVYPNPTDNVLVIQPNNNMVARTLDFTLTDVLGRIVMKEHDVRNQVYFDRSKIPSGLYFYKVTDSLNIILLQGQVVFK